MMQILGHSLMDNLWMIQLNERFAHAVMVA